MGTYLNRATNFFEFLAEYYDQVVALDEIDEDKHVYPFKFHLEENVAKTNMRSTIITCADCFRILDRSDDFDVDPSQWANVEDGLPSSNEVRDRTNSSDDVTPADVGAALLDIVHPLYHALFLLLFKLMPRIGEAANIELRHIHLRDPDFYRIYDDLGIELHPAIRNKPDTIYIPSDKDGNKRDENTILPVDQEVKTALLRALAIRPTTPKSLEDGHFFASHSTNYGLKPSPSSLDDAFDRYVVAPNDQIPDEMTPHDARHWGTRQLRSIQTDNEVLNAYLRGDSDELRDHYDKLVANYEERVRDRYERQMPSLFF